MSPPIYTPDGSEVSEIVLPDGSTASEVIGPDGNVVFEAGPDIPDSGIARWKFEQTTDDAWNNYDLTDNTSAGYVTGQVGDYAKTYDGTADTTDRGNISQLDGLSEFSIGGWIQWNQYGGGDGNTSPFDYRVDENNLVQIREANAFDALNFRVVNGGTEAKFNAPLSTYAPLDTWVHLFLTFSSGTLTAYADGSSIGTASGPSSLFDDTSASWTNAQGVAYGTYAEMKLDNIDIYSKELTSTEVSNHKTTGSING